MTVYGIYKYVIQCVDARERSFWLQFNKCLMVKTIQYEDLPQGITLPHNILLDVMKTQNIR